MAERIAAVHSKYRTSLLRSRHTNRQNSAGPIEPASSPEYVSILQRR